MDESARRAGKLAVGALFTVSLAGCILTVPSNQTLPEFLGINTLNKQAESPNAAIKQAAIVKKEVKLKKCKIKALKYLATVGCGCYDKEGEITKALLASMADCDEDVRMAAVKAVMKTSRGGCPGDACGTSCCKKEIVEQLSKMAWEVDDKGCWIEPSERVRKAAAQAACMCCPDEGPIMTEPGVGGPVPETGPKPERSGEPSTLDGTEPPAAGAGDADDIDDDGLTKLFRDANILPTDAEVEVASSQAPVAAPEVPGRAFIANYQEPVVIYRNLAVQAPADHWPSYGTGRRIHPRNAAPRQTVADDSSVRGIVRYVDPHHGVAHVEFPSLARVAPGTKLVVRHDYLLGRLSSVGHMEVVTSEPGAATVRALGTFSLAKVSSGDQVIVELENS